MVTQPIPSAPGASNLSFKSRNIFINNNYEWSQPETPKVSKTKAMLAQCLAVFPIFLINFSNAVFFYFIVYSYSLLASKLLNEHVVMYAAGLIVGGVSAQIIGSRLMIILGSIILAGSWVILPWVSSITALTWLFRVVGITRGMMQSPSFVYLAEIAQPNARGALMATVSLSQVVGSYFYKYVGQIVSLTTFRWINLIFPIVGFAVMIILPESPHWLANKGRYQRVESSLAWFRGWTIPTNVKVESTAIIDHAQNNLSTLKLFGKKSVYLSLLIVSYVFALKAFSGTEYLKLGLLMASTATDKFNIFLILDYGCSLATLGFVLAVAIISKRILILLSLFGGALALLLGIILCYVNLDELVSAWLFPICMIVATLILHFGLSHVPLLLNAELFPSRIRYVGAGIGLFILDGLQYSSDFIYQKYVTFPPFTLIEYFAMLGCINFFGFLSLCWLFPRNENKSLVKIEQSCNSVNNLRRKH